MTSAEIGPRWAAATRLKLAATAAIPARMANAVRGDVAFRGIR